MLQHEQLTARPEDTIRFAQSGDRIWYRAKNEGGHDRVERGIGVGERLGICHLQYYWGAAPGRELPGPLQHPWGDIDRCHLCFGRVVRHVPARPDADLEHSFAPHPAPQF